MSDPLIATLYATLGGLLTAVVAWAKERVKKHEDDPTVVAVLQDRNDELMSLHRANLDRIRALEDELREIRRDMGQMSTDLMHAKERIGFLTGQMTKPASSEDAAR